MTIAKDITQKYIAVSPASQRRPLARGVSNETLGAMGLPICPDCGNGDFLRPTLHGYECPRHPETPPQRPNLPIEASKTVGVVRLGKVRRDVTQVSEALSIVKAGDVDCGSILRVAALRLETQAAHLKTIARDIGERNGKN